METKNTHVPYRLCSRTHDHAVIWPIYRTLNRRESREDGSALIRRIARFTGRNEETVANVIFDCMDCAKRFTCGQ